MDTQRLILFVVFSFSILMLWESWQKEQHPLPTEQTTTVTTTPGISAVPAPPQNAKEATPGNLLASAEKIRVRTDYLDLDIDTQGGDIRRIELRKHRDALEADKNYLLMTEKKPGLYIAQSGLVGNGLPDHRSRFTAVSQNYEMKPGQEQLQVTLSAIGENGVKVDKVFTFYRGSYLIDVAFRIQNSGSESLNPSAYYQLVRDGSLADASSMFISTFTGAAVYTDAHKFQKIEFKDIQKNRADFVKNSVDGWIGMVQHYFVSAWLPKEGKDREFYTKSLGDNLFSAGVILPVGSIAVGASGEITVPLYAGPEEQEKLNSIAPGLDLTVDYGWLTIIAAPLYWVLEKIHRAVGNWGIAIIALTVLIKLAFYPLSAASYRSMAQMRVIGPKLQRLKEQYGDDRQRLHEAMMNLYKTEKINPLGGCLPILIQIPVFIALYWVLLGTVELRHAPFMLWITDLSAPDPYYILPVVMGVTMVVQTKLNPTPPDPIQAKVMAFMPYVFSIFFFFFPAGLVLYWVVNNVLSIAQQWQITRAMEGAKGHAKG